MERLFGRYDLRREIGRGAFGTVYEVVDVLNGLECALKTFSPRWVQEHLIERFRREFALVARMPHKRLIKVFDFGHENGKYFYTMELAQGPTLDKLELSEEQKLSVLCDISEGLMHLDLKPANIFVTADGAKIADFGLANAISEDVISASGTAGYIAPEVIRGHKPDLRADLYSFGVIFAELFIGKNPFEGDSVAATIHSHLHLHIDEAVLEAVPREFRNIVESLLNKNPEGRPKSAYVIWRKLAKILHREDNPSLQASVLPQSALIGRDHIMSKAESLLGRIKGKYLWQLCGPR